MNFRKNYPIKNKRHSSSECLLLSFPLITGFIRQSQSSSSLPAVDEVDDEQWDQERPYDAEVNLLPHGVVPLLDESKVSNRDSYDPDGCDDNPISQCHDLYEKFVFLT